MRVYNVPFLFFGNFYPFLPGIPITLLSFYCRYGLNLWIYNGPIQNGLRCALTEHPELEAVLMGTRRTDPSGQNLGYFEVIYEASVLCVQS